MIKIFIAHKFRNSSRLEIFANDQSASYDPTTKDFASLNSK